MAVVTAHFGECLSTILPDLRFSINKNLVAHDSETSVSILLEDPLLDWYTGEAKWPHLACVANGFSANMDNNIELILDKYV